MLRDEAAAAAERCVGQGTISVDVSFVAISRADYGRTRDRPASRRDAVRADLQVPLTLA